MPRDRTAGQLASEGAGSSASMGDLVCDHRLVEVEMVRRYLAGHLDSALPAATILRMPVQTEQWQSLPRPK